MAGMSKQREGPGNRGESKTLQHNQRGQLQEGLQTATGQMDWRQAGDLFLTQSQSAPRAHPGELRHKGGSRRETLKGLGTVWIYRPEAVQEGDHGDDTR